MKPFVHLILAALSFASALFATSVLAVDDQQFHANPKAGVDYYLSTYGQVPKSQLPLIYDVFDQVMAAADKNPFYAPNLIVINDRENAAVFVLSDGNIFISQKAIDLMFNNVAEDEAATRLAFVIGHELAHLAHNDFSDELVNKALLDNEEQAGGSHFLSTGTGQLQNELKADDLGFLYAALAGFDVGVLLQPTESASNFFTLWADKVDLADNGQYPAMAQRAAFLQQRLQEKYFLLDNYFFGVRLAYFDRYDKAISLLEAFQREFPSREVFNNLGLVYLRSAVDKMHPNFGYYYWLPKVGDLSSRLSLLTTRSGDLWDWRNRGDSALYPAAVRESLLQAIRYFKLAIEKDRLYRPAFENLATAQFLLDAGSNTVISQLGSPSYSRTIAAIEDALQFNQNDPQLLTMLAISLHEAGRADDAKQLIDNVFEPPNELPLSISYNLLRLDEALEQSPQLNNVIAQLEHFPFQVQQLLCQQYQQEITDQQGENQYQAVCLNRTFPGFNKSGFPWDLPLALNRDLLEYPINDTQKAGLGLVERRLSQGGVFEHDDYAVLAVDDITSLLVLRQDDLGQANKLISCCGEPFTKEQLVNRTLWHYNHWAVVLDGETIEEVWINAH